MVARPNLITNKRKCNTPDQKVVFQVIGWLAATKMKSQQPCRKCQPYLQNFSLIQSLVWMSKLCIYMILFIIKSYLHPYDIPSLQTSQRYSIWLWIMYPLSRVPFWCHGAVFSASPLLMQRMQSFVHGLDVRGASATGGKKANVGSRHLMLIYINITRLYIPSLKLT